MQMIADLHIHSKYSRATSTKMDIDTLSAQAKLKGINLIGTGDFTHPIWIKELKEKLSKDSETGFYTNDGTYFVPQTEISLMYTDQGKGRKVHQCVLSPDLETAEQITDWIKTKGRVDYDGRPIFGFNSEEFVEKIMEINKDNFVFPAHIWTPWFGLLGSMSGFDSIEDCYKDQTKHIHAIETGLSSDPAMNWRLSKLDKFTPISNSDAHSPWPFRLGREANVFELKKPSYKEIIDAIIKKDKSRFLYTIEVDPSYGKYHFDGHRNCGIVMNPKDSIAQKDFCPKCKKRMTLGVLHRVTELADRPEGFIPNDAIPFKTLIPVQEIISGVYRQNILTKKITLLFRKLLARFNTELDILLNAPEKDIAEETSPELAKALILNREGKVFVKPGYDGEYGKPEFPQNMLLGKPTKQKSIGEF